MENNIQIEPRHSPEASFTVGIAVAKEVVIGISKRYHKARLKSRMSRLTGCKAWALRAPWAIPDE